MPDGTAGMALLIEEACPPYNTLAGGGAGARDRKGTAFLGTDGFGDLETAHQSCSNCNRYLKFICFLRT